MSDYAIVPRGSDDLPSRGLRLESFDDMLKFSEMVVTAKACKPGMTPATCFIAIQYGLEVGFSPMQALQCVAVIQGQPVCYGDGPLALCRTHRAWDGKVFSEKVEGEGEAMVATCTVGRLDESPVTVSFSMADARKAGLTNNPMYAKYPQRMLKFKARMWALRDKFPDRLKGLVSEDEANEVIDSRRGTQRVDLGGKDSFVNAPTIDVTPPKPAKVTPQAGGAWTADKIAEKRPRRMATDMKRAAEAQDAARQVRQEAAAAEKAAPKDRETIIRLRTYLPRLKAVGLNWKTFVADDPHKRTDEELEAIMHDMEMKMTDAFFEQQTQNKPEGGEAPAREPGED